MPWPVWNSVREFLITSHRRQDEQFLVVASNPSSSQGHAASSARHSRKNIGPLWTCRGLHCLCGRYLCGFPPLHISQKVLAILRF